MKSGWMAVGFLVLAAAALLARGDDVAATTQATTEPAQAAEGKLLSGVPILRADNIERLAAFYRDKLRFRVLFGGQKQSWYAAIERDGLILHIARPTGEFGAVAVFVSVKNVDALYAEFVAHGVKAEGKPRVDGHGIKHFAVTDAEGNHLNFGENITK